MRKTIEIGNSLYYGMVEKILAGASYIVSTERKEGRSGTYRPTKISAAGECNLLESLHKELEKRYAKRHEYFAYASLALAAQELIRDVDCEECRKCPAWDNRE